MSRIFVLNGENRLTRLDQADYDSEDLLQRLLADHPDLIASALGVEALLLIRREAGVPDAAGGADRWSLDHLFLDSAGVPVLVEVKRASDTRTRREVVAQMLDYAANGVAYWPIAKIVEAFKTTCAEAGEAYEQRLVAFLSEDTDEEEFWRRVESNLVAGRIRMVFLADRIPKELRRIVEFLNEQMRPAEVLAIEVEHYLSQDGLRTLVPRLLGATERAQAVKAINDQISESEEDWLIALQDRHGAEARAKADQALAWFRARGFLAEITHSRDALSFSVLRPSGKRSWPFFIRRSSGKFETALQYLQSDPAFAAPEQRQAILEEIRALVPGKITTTKLTGWPAIPLTDLARPEVWNGVKSLALRVKAAIEQGMETDRA